MKVLITFEVPAEEAGPLIIHATVNHKADMKDFAVPMPPAPPTASAPASFSNPRRKSKVKPKGKSRVGTHGGLTAEDYVREQIGFGPKTTKALKAVMVRHGLDKSSAYWGLKVLGNKGEIEKNEIGLWQKKATKTKAVGREIAI